MTYYSDKRLVLGTQYDSIPGGAVCTFLDISTRTDILIRMQRDYTGLVTGARQWTCEIWNVDSTGYEFHNLPITSAGDPSFNENGINGSTVNTSQFGFVRMDSTLLPVASKPPTTADGGNLVEIKLDGGGTDSSGGGHNMTMTGTWNYPATPDQVAYAFAGTLETKSWSEWLPLRAGYPSGLTGTRSYSMGDSSSAVTCFWQQIPHAATEAVTSTVAFDDRNSCSPMVSGLLFGPYAFRLKVTDGAGSIGTTNFAIGAVAYDENGTVIYPDARLNTILGPELALGKNAWEFFDERFYTHSRYWANQFTINGGLWQNPAKKTDLNGLTLTGTAYWTATTDTRTIYGIGTNFLDVFCGGVAGVCDGDFLVGSAIDETDWGGAGGLRRVIPFSITSCVSQTECTGVRSSVGNSSWYVTNASPGTQWGVLFHDSYPAQSVGTVYATNGSSTINGTGTNLQAFLCNGGSTPITSAAIRIFDGTAYSTYTVTGCTSETQITISGTYTGATISAPGNKYVLKAQEPRIGIWSQGLSSNIVFYDLPASLYRYYYATGDVKVRDAARYIVREYLQSAYYNAWAAGYGLYEIGIGPYVAAVADPDAFEGLDPWPALDFRADGAATRHIHKNFADVRESDYALWNIAFNALYNPDSLRRDHFKDILINHYNWQSVPFQLPSGGYYAVYDTRGGTSVRVLQVANGSSTVTRFSGTSIPSDYCGTAATTAGTISSISGNQINGSGTNFAGTGGKLIVLIGTLSGQPHVELARISTSPAPTATVLYVDYPWRGDANSVDGSVVYIRESGEPLIQFERVNSGGTVKDPRVFETEDIYFCSYVSGDQITLTPAYHGDTAGGTDIYRWGYGQVSAGSTPYSPVTSQPYFDLLRVEPYMLAAQAIDGYDNTVASGFRTQAQEIFTYVHSLITASGGLPYFASAPTCLPYSASVKTPCSYYLPSDGTSAIEISRDFMLEVSSAAARLYSYTGDPTDLANGDEMFQLVFGEPGYASPYVSDGYSSEGIKTTAAATVNKNYGQAMGHGGGPEWGAARVGGPLAPVNQSPLFGFNLASVLGSVDVAITKRLPTGETSTQVCTSSPCTLTGIDVRAGGWLAERYCYRDGSGNNLACSSIPIFNPN